MANNPKLSSASRDLAMNAGLDVLNGGSILILDGTQPASPETAIGAQVTLAQLAFSATAFAAASGGSKTANAITADSSADATGTASWARLRKSDATAVWDLSVGTASADIVFNSTSISAGAQVSITSLVASMAA